MLATATLPPPVTSRSSPGRVNPDATLQNSAASQTYPPPLEVPALPSPRRDSHQPASSIPATVLVVDDNPSAQELVRKLLKGDGYRVICIDNGPDALLASRDLPDVVLLDLMMPDMDGFEVCRRIRADPITALVPIILLTALDDRESRLRGLEAGADDFLSKPFDFAELRARLRTITRLNRYRCLYEGRARFEAAIANAPEAIVLAELDGTIIHRNAAFTKLLDPDVPELENFFAYLPSACSLRLRSQLHQPDQRGRESPLHFARRQKTVVEITHGIVPWQGRGIVQYHLRDLTEHKSLETQLLQAQRIELLGQLAGSIVHDMNNILHVIDCSVSVLEMEPNHDREQHFNNIHTGINRGAALLAQLLQFTRGSDGILKLANPVAAVAEVASLVRESFGRTIGVEFAFEQNLPSIQLDPTQMHQVVMNLCVNARDAMPQGGRIEIAIARRTVDEAAARLAGPGAIPGDFVTVAVRDHGSGIPTENLPRLFDPFFTTKPEGKGTGLGLATVSRLVRRHGGFVTVTTAVAQGSCFTCHFPIPDGNARRNLIDG